MMVKVERPRYRVFNYFRRSTTINGIVSLWTSTALDLPNKVCFVSAVTRRNTGSLLSSLVQMLYGVVWIRSAMWTVGRFRSWPSKLVRHSSRVPSVTWVWVRMYHRTHARCGWIKGQISEYASLDYCNRIDKCGVTGSPVDGCITDVRSSSQTSFVQCLGIYQSKANA